MEPDFIAFILRRLQADGMVFSSFDFELFKRGKYTWSVMKKAKALSPERRADLFLTQASSLAFVSEHRWADGMAGAPARVQAQVKDFPGDVYWLCLEASLSDLLTEYYTETTWMLEGDSGPAAL